MFNELINDGFDFRAADEIVMIIDYKDSVKKAAVFNNKFYAVAFGKQQGIYKTWAECEAQIKGFRKPVYRKFTTKEEAENFILQHNRKYGPMQNVKIAGDTTRDKKEASKETIKYICNEKEYEEHFDKFMDKTIQFSDILTAVLQNAKECVHIKNSRCATIQLLFCDTKLDSGKYLVLELWGVWCTDGKSEYEFLLDNCGNIISANQYGYWPHKDMFDLYTGELMTA